MSRKCYLILLLISIVCGCTQTSTNKTPPGTLLSVKELQELLKEDNLKGKVTLVDFWATWCGPCRMQIPVLVKLQSKYKSEGLQIIGVSVDRPGFRMTDSQKAVSDMVIKLKVNYPVGIADDTILEKFPPITAIPTAKIFDREGKEVKTITGMHPENSLEQILKELGITVPWYKSLYRSLFQS